MSLAELRDLFIVIFSILGIGASVLFSILAFLLYRRIRAILDSGKATVGNIRAITSLVSENIVKPLAGIAGVVQGVRQAVDFISGLSKGKEGKRSGQ